MRWSYAVVIAFAVMLTITAVLLGVGMVLQLCALIGIEVAFSFDNAIINAGVLRRMTAAWQRAFMTLGIAIAVVGVRLLLPVVIVMSTARLGFWDTLRLAIIKPHQYTTRLDAVQHQIAMLSGMFLLLLALQFLCTEHDNAWLRLVERYLAKIGKRWYCKYFVLSFVVLVVLAIVRFTVADGRSLDVLGFISAVAFGALQLVTNALEGVAQGDEHRAGWWRGLALFGYLEILDASFSFDGLAGAFAVTHRVLLIAIGLGFGAVVVRLLTVRVVRRGTIEKYRYLESGAYWAILALAASQLLSLYVGVSSYVPGVLGLGIMGAALVCSYCADRREGKSSVKVV